MLNLSVYHSLLRFWRAISSPVPDWRRSSLEKQNSRRDAKAQRKTGKILLSSLTALKTF